MKRSFALPTSLVFMMSCALDPTAIPSACSAPCPAWSQRVDGRCERRVWHRPSSSDAIGEPGAAHPVIAARAGEVLLGFTVASAASNRVFVAERRAAATSFVVRDPGALLANATGAIDVALGDDGAALATYWQGDGATDAIFVSERSPSGAWKDPSTPSDRVSLADTAYEPRVAMGEDGSEILLWNQHYSAAGEGHYGVAVATRDDRASPWTFPKGPSEFLSPDIYFSNAPRVASGPKGASVVTWYQSVGGPLMVFASDRSGAHAAFSRPALDGYISPAGGAVDSHPTTNPVPATGPRGEAAIVWTQALDVSDMHKGVFVALRGASGRFDPPKDLSDALSTPTVTARCPQAAYGPEGELWVAWYEEPSDGSHVVRVALRDPEGVWRHRGEQALAASSADALGPALAVGPDGGVLVVWSELLRGAYQVVARRGDWRNGLGSAEVISPEGGIDALEPVAAIDARTGRAWVAWTQGAYGFGRVYTADIE